MFKNSNTDIAIIVAIIIKIFVVSHDVISPGGCWGLLRISISQ